MARTIERICIYCHIKKVQLAEQKVGILPVERVAFKAPPFLAISLDLLGPILTKGVVNKRAHEKVWPVLFVCQASGAIHINVMHNYRTDAFLLQWDSFTAIRGISSKVVSDQGSQPTASNNVIAFPEKEDPT